MVKKILVALTACTALVILAIPSFAAKPTAAVLRTGFPGEDPALTSAVESRISSAGYAVERVGLDELCDAKRLNASKYSLLVLPDSSALPAASGSVIDGFLRGGGDLIALNAPMWRTTYMRAGDRWLTLERYQLDAAQQLPDRQLLAWTPSDIEGWRRGSSHMANAATFETVADGPASGQRAFHVTLANQQGYDTFNSKPMNKPFPDGETLTVFSAKGDEQTRNLSIEWGEKDGSRWIAAVKLSTQWKRYILKPQDFKYWESNPKRGFGGDVFNPAQANSLTIGLSYSHTGYTPGRHEFWVGPFGTSAMTEAHANYLTAGATPTLDTLSPTYKFFDVTGAGKLSVRADQCVAKTGSISLPASVSSPQPRPRGAGFDKGRAWRFIPILQAATSNGEWRGTPVTMTVNTDGDYKGSVWTAFGVHDPAWYKTDAALSIIQQAAAKTRDGLFMVDGGTNYFTYFADQSPLLGVNVVNLNGAASRSVIARVTLTQTATGKTITSRTWPIALAGMKPARAAATWKPKTWPVGAVTATAQILVNGKVVDTVSHDVNVWRPKAKPSFVTIKDGDFMLNGKKWRVHGVNYMPSSGIGTEDGNYFEAWIGARPYDPEIIERDLRHCKDIGLNSVSIFIYRDSIEAQNLVDILLRLDRLGMKANVSLRPGTPIEFPWQSVKEMIQYLRLKQNDTVFAYDLAWEPWLGSHDARKIFDPEWESWVVERYGSIANAERDWGYEIPRDENGKVTNPSPEHLGEGEWHRMTAAYRRFTDTVLYKRYGEARRLVRTIDSNHFVSFRMSDAGNPTLQWTSMMPYDFPYLSAGVDILEPEAYGRIGDDWETVKPGWFEFEYARWADARRPMLWAEMGVSAWDMSAMTSPTDKLEYQARYLTQFYRMMQSSGCDGIFYWWYPGGFRTGENSDYGIINPDGSDRPSTKVIRANTSQFMNNYVTKPVNEWIEFDRDRHPIGIGGVYDEAKDAFWKAIDEGKTPGLRTAGTGTTSANCPALAVGNTPLNGNNPAKYLDGAFDLVEVLTTSGGWAKVVNGAAIPASAAKPLVARFSITNLAEAKWLAKAGTGAVALKAYSNGREVKTFALPSDVASHRSTTLRVSLDGLTGPIRFRLSAAGRTPFGEELTLNLR